MHPSRLALCASLSVALSVCAVACKREPEEQAQARVQQTLSLPAKRTPAPAMTEFVLQNAFAYIPAQCYTKTRDERGTVANPCYVCHTDSTPPNYVNDSEFQSVLRFPKLAAKNAWSNLFTPAIERAAAIDDAALDHYVATSNYVDAEGALVLPAKLQALPEAWDGDADARWGGYVPDAYFRFDAEGYDLAPDGARTGWRAFAYAPLPGTFFPTNGSAGDVLIRIDPALRQRADGTPDARVEATNLAIIEALISRRDVAIAATDEAVLAVDLDLDGKLGHATRVRPGIANERTRLHYVGRAHELELAGSFPIAPGLFPLNTEFLHSVRYLDASAARVRMAARMKELRYSKKVRWFSDAELKAHVAAEAVELQESKDGAMIVSWQHDRGAYNKAGWLLQGFIEAADGTLRPQTFEETAYCVGCHGGIGVTTDSTFSFARKLSGPRGGWFHWSQQGFVRLPEPKREDGRYEYSLYLQQNHAGDEFRDNTEVGARFVAEDGALRPTAIQKLHTDISTLLLPSPERARALNRAYRAVVVEQSFIHGRETVLAPSPRVHREVEADALTGIERPVTAQR